MSETSEMDYWNGIEQAFRDQYHVAQFTKVGGERDFEAGHRDRSTTEYRLDLRADVADTIRQQIEDDPNDESSTLDMLVQQFEDTLGLVIGEYEQGHLYVSATYDGRGGGSL